MMNPQPQGLSSSSLASSQEQQHQQTNRPLRQELFRSPLISVLYERILPPIWNLGLRLGGPDTEYQNAAKYLLFQQQDRNDINNNKSDREEAGEAPKLILDLCCGTGFVALRMASQSKRIVGHVFALDYSTQMLEECVASVKRGYFSSSLTAAAANTNSDDFLPLSIIRGNAGSLPFRDSCLDAVHWGAAMHCVPDAGACMKEVYRVLKPGGKMYATTFLRPFPDLVFRFFTPQELREISREAGFDERSGGALQVERRGLYGIVRATKKVE